MNESWKYAANIRKDSVLFLIMRFLKKEREKIIQKLQYFENN